MASIASKYQGVIVPMATPFTEAGELDEPAVRRVIDHLLDGLVSGVFVLGTTGEAHSMPQPARSRLVEITTKHVGERAMTYAGISSTCFADTVRAAEDYSALGVDAVVAHVPHYYPLDGDSMLRYYTKLADKIAAPLVIYNIRATTHMSIPVDVLEKLADHPRVVALKDSDHNEERYTAILNRLGGKDDFSFLVGALPLASEAFQLGAKGMVPAGANLAPRPFQSMMEHARQGNWDEVNALQEQIDSVAATFQRGRSMGQSLAALKIAMNALGLCGPTVLPPLIPADAEEQAKVRDALKGIASIVDGV
jgi:4-hydroxy-tetrahydrodipicolinate synthase